MKISLSEALIKAEKRIKELEIQNSFLKSELKRKQAKEPSQYKTNPGYWANQDVYIPEGWHEMGH